MIWQTKPDYRKNCNFVILNLFNTHFGGCMNIPSPPSRTVSEPLSWLRKRELVSHVLFIGWSLWASLGSSQSKGTVLHIISLQSSEQDGAKTLPPPAGELSRLSSQGTVKSDVCFGIQKTLFEICMKLSKFPSSGNLWWNIVGFFSYHQAIMLYARNRKFGHSEILFSGNQGNPIASPSSPQPHFCSSCSYKWAVRLQQQQWNWFPWV